jgi:cell division protein FtsB
MVKKKIKIKKIGRWIFLFIAIILLYSIFFTRTGLIEIYKSYMNIKKKENLIKEKHKAIDSLTIENQKLKNDTSYIEKIAREKYGMLRKDEKVYKFIKEKNNDE